MRLSAFLGACLLTGALLMPHAGMEPVIAGLALAAVIQWAWYQMKIGQRRQ